MSLKMKNRILFFAFALIALFTQQQVFAGSGNGNTLPEVSMRTLSADSTLGMGNCSNGLYLIGQSFDKVNPRFPYRILIRITYISADGEMTYSALTKEGNSLEELYDQINYETGFANFAIDLGGCSSKPQTVSVTSLYRADNEAIEMFTNSTPLVSAPKAPAE